MEIPTPPTCQAPQAQPDSNRKKRFSFTSLLDSLVESISRFPITYCYLAAFAVWGVIDCWLDRSFIDDAPLLIQNLEPSLWFLTITGILLSLAISLWCEYSGKNTKQWIIQIIPNNLLLADFVYMVFNFKTMNDVYFIAHAAIVTALIVAIIFVPALKRLSPQQSLMYSYIQFSNLVACGIICIVLETAYFIIFSTITLLFGDINYKIFLSVQIVFAVTLTIAIFLCRVPCLTETIRQSINFKPTKFITGLIRYTLLPLTVIYMVVLYAYGINICMYGELPQGIICYMVTALTCVVFMALFLLKAIDTNASNRLTAVSLRALPLALIPLLVMMSVAIGQRIDQYGITTDRLYVITFNIWAYLAAIYLFATNSKRINTVALSFAVVFLLTSIIPTANYTVIVQRYMRNHIFSILDNAGISKDQLPLSHNNMVKLSETLDKDTWQDLSSKLKYLDSHEDHSLTNDIVDFEIKTSSWSYNELFDDEMVEVIEVAKTIYFSSDQTVKIPSGFDNARHLNKYRYDIKADTAGIVEFSLSDSCTIRLDIDVLRSYDEHEPHQAALFDIKEDSSSVFVPLLICYNLDDDEFKSKNTVSSLSIEGFLFTKDKKRQ